MVHCSSESQAIAVRDAIAARLAQVGLELHPDKTRIVYCKDADRRGGHEVTSFTFLGYEFRPGWPIAGPNTHFVSFLPAVSAQAMRAMGREIRSWHLARRSDKSLDDLARLFNNIVQGWINYYGRFYRSRLFYFLRRLSRHLTRWACRKYKRLKRRERRAMGWLALPRSPGDLPAVRACSRAGALARVLTAGRWEPDESEGRFCESRAVQSRPAIHRCLLVSGTTDDAEALRREIAEVLSTMALRLSQVKTLVTHIDEGLDFLGWHIQCHRKPGTEQLDVYTPPRSGPWRP